MTLGKILFSILLLLISVNYSVAQQRSSVCGGPFSPRGDLRFLVIFAGYESDCVPESPLYNNPGWPEENPGQNSAPCKTLPAEYKSLFYENFTQFSPEAQDRTLSNFFYQMSRHHPRNPPLRIVADFFPERINIAGHHPDNYQVFTRIKEKHPTFDWSRYDLRKNTPDFTFSNDTTGPDGDLDYVIVIWRNKGCSGYASLNTDFTFNTKSGETEQQFRVKSNCGFTITNSIFHLQGLKSLFLHELAHTLYNCPHYYFANQVLGNYFYSSSGWGMMMYGEITGTANAWESWYLGWTELPPDRDLTPSRGGGTFRLKDFATTGDAMRIKIPGTGQRLWLENHTGKSSIDHRDGWEKDGEGVEIPPVKTGLFAFIENITDTREEIITPLSLKYSNGLKAISSEGNFDYTASDEKRDKHLWGNYTADFVAGIPNPASQHNGLAVVRGNFNYDTLFPESIIQRNYTNGASEFSSSCDTKVKGKISVEGYKIYRKQGIYSFESTGINMAFNIPGQKMGLGSNPMIVNLQRYDECRQVTEPVILHGLSVEITDLDTVTGEITVKVRYDDNEVKTDYRLSGNLYLSDDPLLQEDLIIGKGVEIKIDKSGTPDRHTTGFKPGTTAEFPDFITPSLLTIPAGATLSLRKKAVLKIKAGSTLYIRKGATINIETQARIIIEKGAYLHMEEGVTLNKKERSGIITRKGSLIGLNPLLINYRL